MPNVSLRGKIVDEHGDGLAGLGVEALDIDILYLQDLLGSTQTLPTGEFTLSYPSAAYGLERFPDIRFTVTDPVGRKLYESDTYPQVKDPVLDVGTIVIPTEVVRGFRVTLRNGFSASVPPLPPKDPFPLLTHGNWVQPLIDNELAWAELTTAMEHAATSIHLVQLWFNIGQLTTVFVPPNPILGQPTTGSKLEQLLLDRNRTAGVKVRILLNDVKHDPGILDSLRTVRKYFSSMRRHAPHTVEVRGFPRPYNTPMHAKFTVIDDTTAYVIGSPLIQGYYDGQAHHVDDPRRGIKSFFEHTDCSPLHDVSAVVRGPVVEDLNSTFRALWERVSGASLPAAAPPRAPTTNATVQVVRTLPGKLLAATPQGERGILEAYLRAIREAQDFIFFDNQYFTEPMIGTALARALTVNRQLQVIMVINPRVDIPFYNTLQPNLINKMLSSLDSQARDRIGLFSLWSHEFVRNAHRIIRIYTHAKIGVVDDHWATIGSANLDGVSLRLSQHVVPPISDRDRLEERGIEVNLVIFNEVDGLPPSSVPGDLRRMLWAEYLGYDSPNDPDLMVPPVGGWLALWQARADAKLRSLQLTPPAIHPSRVLAWQAETDPAKHLLAIGLTKSNLKNLVVETSGRSFNFKSGQWE